ncbi:MAG TPA: response regulator [Geobacteraceae bacterium]
MEEKVRILCVDDEVNVLRALKRSFLDSDYDVITAASGEEGLAALAGDTPVQIVMSDYRMPGMNGVDFLREVRRRWPETVRIVLSGYADIAAVISAVNEGEIYHFIAKPWNDDDLRVTMANAVERFHCNEIRVDLAQQLKAKNDELQRINCAHILDALPVGVVCIDTDGLVVQCNREARRLLDVSPVRAIGIGRRDLLPDELNLFVEKIAEGNGAVLSTTIKGGGVRVVGGGMKGAGREEVALVLESGEGAGH